MDQGLKAQIFLSPIPRNTSGLNSLNSIANSLSDMNGIAKQHKNIELGYSIHKLMNLLAHSYFARI